MECVMACLARTNLYVEVTQLRIFPISCKGHGTHTETVVTRWQLLQLVRASIVEKLTACDALHHRTVLHEQKTRPKLGTETRQDILEASCLHPQL